MMNRRTWIFFLFALVASTACSKGARNNIEHAGPVTTEQEQSTGQAAVARPNPKIVGDLEKLGQRVLDSEYLNKPDRTSFRELNLEIHALNSAIIENRDQLKASPKLRVLLRRYKDVILESCDEKLRFCTNARYFQPSYLTSQVLLLIASYETNVKSYYQLLNLADDLLNQSESTALTLMYLARSDEYSKHLKDQPSALSKHKMYMDNLLANFTLSETSDDRGVVADLLKNYNPWDLNKLSSGTSIADTEMFKVASKSFLYTKEGKLNPSLKNQLEKESKSQDEESYWQIKAKIEASVLKQKLMKHIDLNIPNDEFLFLVDRLFTNKLNGSDLKEFLASLRLKHGRTDANKRLINTAIAYYYAQIGQAILETKAFADKELMLGLGTGASIYNKAEMFNAIIQKSTPLARKWNKLVESKNRVFDFVNSEIGIDNEAHTLLIALDRNIKYLSIYPMMTIMSYYIAHFDLSFTLYGFFGSYDVNSKRIITDFMEGETDPWFNFTPDTRALERAEILLSLHYLNQLDLLNNSSLLTAEDMFHKVIERYLSDAQNAADSILTNLKSYKRSFKVDDLIEYCEAEKSVRRCETDSYCTDTPKASGERPNYAISINGADEFKKYSFLGQVSSSATSSGQLRYFNEFNHASAGMSLDTYLEKLQTTYYPQVSFVKTVLDSLQLENSGGHQYERIRSLIAGLETKIKESLEFINAENRRSSQCLYLFAEIEYDQQLSIIEKEVERLSQLHDDIVLMKQNKLSLEELNKTLVVGGSSFANFDRVDSNGNYRLSASDSILRFRNYLKQVNPNVDVNLSNFVNSSEYKSQTRSYINFNPNKKAFVSAALRALVGSDSSTFAWLKDTVSLDLLKDRFDQLIRIDSLNAIVGVKTPQVSLIEERKQLLELIDISEREEEVFDYLGRATKFPYSSIRDVLFDAKMDPWDLHSYTLKKMSESEVYFQESKRMHNTLDSTGTLLFPVNNTLYENFKANYRPVLLSLIGQVNQFIDDAEQDGSNGVPSIRYALGGSEEQDLVLSFRENMISPIDRSNWKTKVCDITYSTREKLFSAQEVKCK